MYIIKSSVVLILCFGIMISLSYAQETTAESSAAQDQPRQAAMASDDTGQLEVKGPDNADDKEKVQISQDVVTGELPSYNYSLKQLIEMANKNIQKVDKELKEKEVFKQNQEQELTARKYFEKGNALYEEGKLEEAKKQWQQALTVTQDPKMKNYVEQAEKTAVEQHRKQEDARSKKIASLYDEAVSLYKINNIDDAQELFEQVLSLDPVNQRAKRYVDINIPSRRKQMEADAQRRRKEQEAQQAAEKERKQKELQRQQQLKQENLDKEKALAERKAKEEERLKLKAEQKQQELEKQKQREQQKQKIQQALAQEKAQKEKQRQQKDNQRQQEEQKKQQALVEKKAKEAQQCQMENKTSALYEGAVNLYRDGKYDKAYTQFKAVKEQIPNYKRSNYYIDRIEEIKKQPAGKK